jgi:hypothetical protein
LAAWVCLCGATVQAQVQTPVIGRVIAVEKGSVLIQPEEAGAQPVRVPLGPDDSPGMLVSGARVRLWSDRDTAAGRQAWRLDPQTHGRLGDVDRDRTGVRSRIGRGAGRGGGGAGGGQHGR